MKAAKDRDLYCEWSSICDSPTFIGDREAMRKRFGEDRVARADEHGTSLLGFATRGDYPPSELDGAWEDTGLVVEQRGWLPRGRVADFLEAFLADGEAKAYALLEPFEDDTPAPSSQENSEDRS
jgi:hypothetical protein